MSSMTNVRIQTVEHDYNSKRFLYGIEPISMKFNFFPIFNYEKIKKVVFLEFNNALRVGLSELLRLFSRINFFLLYFRAQVPVFLIFFHQINIYRLIIHFYQKNSMKPSQTQKGLSVMVTPTNNCIWNCTLVWGWKKLRDQLFKEEIKLKGSQDFQSLVSILNHTSFKSTPLLRSICLVEVGFGRDPIDYINKEVSERFSFSYNPPLKLNPIENQLTVYGYMNEQVQFQYPFSKMKIDFKQKKVSGFSAETKSQKKQILVHQYTSQDQFIISLKTKKENKKIFLLKTEKQTTLDSVEKTISSVDKKGRSIGTSDRFEMPLINFNYQHSVENLKGKEVENRVGSFIGEVKQILKFSFKDQNDRLSTSRQIEDLFSDFSPKYYYLDKPFWLVMKEDHEKPYLIMYIEDPKEYKIRKRKDCNCCTY